MTVRCDDCEHKTWRLETSQEKVAPYCAWDCANFRENEDYGDCKVYVKKGPREWKKAE